MTKANLKGYLADGMLLRMSVINPDYDQAMVQMTSFIKDMLAHSGSATHKLMIGDA